MNIAKNTKKNRNKLFSSTFVYLISFSLTRFVGFLLLPLYTNVLSTEEFGNYSLLMALYAVFNVLYQAGLLQGLTGFFFKEEYSREKVVTTVLLELIFVCLSFAAILTIFAPLFSRVLLSDSGLTTLFILMVWVLFIDNLSFLGLHLLKTEQRAVKAAVFSIIVAVANIFFNFFFMLSCKLGIKGIFFAQALSGLLLFILSLPTIFKYLLPLIKERISIFDKELASKIFLFSFPFALAGIFGILMEVADRFVIDIYMTREHVGLYSFAYKIGSIMSLFVISFRTAFLPHSLNEKDEKDFGVGLKNSFNVFFASMCVIFLSILFFAKDIGDISVAGKRLINPEYMSSFYAVPYILLGYMFNGFASFFSLGPYITGKSYHFIVSDVLGLVINLILNLILIPRYELSGAAIATMIGFILSSIYLYLIFIKSIDFSFSLLRLAVVLIGTVLAAVAGRYAVNIFLKIIVLAACSFVFYVTVRLKITKTLQ